MCMNILNKNILFLFVLLLIPFLGFGQTKKAFLKEAEKSFINKNYYAALIYYKKVLEFDEQDTMVIFKAAESARLFNAYSRAAEMYSYLLDTLQYQDDPLVAFHLASMYQSTGKYDESEKYYQVFLTAYDKIDPFYELKAQKELKAIELAKILVSSAKKTVQISKVEEGVNTPYSEVAAFEHKGDLWYSSMQYKEKDPVVKPAREISKLLKKKEDEAPQLLEGYINDRDLLISNSTFSPNGKKLLYTVCTYINGSEMRCQIMMSDVDENGVLSNEVVLPDPINLQNTTSTHPCLVLDSLTNKEVLYFVSDREGGQGGLDIWYSTIDPKFGYSQPVNIKELNTPSDEVTPFYHVPSGYLFFSSDGRQGMGGFDIFKAIKGTDSFGEILNIGVPYNSSYHDIYYSSDDEGTKAYFSSNREGALFLDSYFESCCYDIYKADIVKLKLDLNALTYDKITGRELKRATVKLIDKDTGKEIGLITNDANNEHIFDLEEDKNYIIVAERENYYPDTIELSTFNKDISETITRKMYLSTDMMLLDVFTFTKIGKFPLQGVTLTLIDMSDNTIKDIIEFNPLSNEFNFMLDRGKQYKLVATKDGFTDAVEEVDTRSYDKPGLITKEMFLDKFVLQDLLPIALYFDNDLPDLGSRTTSTKAIYGNLVNGYMMRKPVYKDKFVKPLAGTTKEAALMEIDDFFEGDVLGGYEKLKMFMVSLLQELEAGNKVELIFKGFASPRAESKYNLTLGQRRVNSVKNEMIFYGNEELKRYFISGQLNITDISFGKELAPADVDGSLKDERNSIYNIKAAKERRVEILRAKRN